MKNLHYPQENKNVWQVQEAKAKFSQVVDQANLNGYQTITKQGQPVAVLLSTKEFEKLTKHKTSLIDFFKAAPCQDVELDTERAKDFPREIEI